MNYPEAHLEDRPSVDQRQRLTRWLADLRVICGQHQVVLDTDGDETRIIDTRSGSVIGVGLMTLLDDVHHPPAVASVECDGSILDGVWLVNTPAGLQEQRFVTD